jgi:hypothetical protein
VVYHAGESRTARWPIVATALVFAAATIAVIALAGILRLTSPLDHRLTDRLDEARAAGQTSGRPLQDFTPFAWDRVCVFGRDATSEQVDATLGIEWGRAGGDAGGFQYLLVFAEGDEVVSAAHVRVGLMPRPERGGECHGPEEAILR